VGVVAFYVKVGGRKRTCRARGVAFQKKGDRLLKSYAQIRVGVGDKNVSKRKGGFRVGTEMCMNLGRKDGPRRNVLCQ